MQSGNTHEVAVGTDIILPILTGVAITARGDDGGIGLGMGMA